MPMWWGRVELQDTEVFTYRCIHFVATGGIVSQTQLVALPIEDRVRNLTKSILARVYTLNVCGYSTLLRSVQ